MSAGYSLVDHVQSEVRLHWGRQGEERFVRERSSTDVKGVETRIYQYFLRDVSVKKVVFHVGSTEISTGVPRDSDFWTGGTAEPTKVFPFTF